MFKQHRQQIDLNDNIPDDVLILSSKKIDIVSSDDVINEEFYETSSKEELCLLLAHRTSQVQKYEVKLKELEQTLQERTEECEKLSVTLEQQQGSVLCKLNDLSETYNMDKKHSEAIIAHLEESERELIITVGKLQKENVDLQSRVEEYESERVEFEKHMRESYEREGNNEEIYDFQKQELAKLKHMLMNSEKEVKKLQFELNENIACLMKSRERNDELENLLLESSKKTDAVRIAFNDVMFEKKKLLKRTEETEALYKILLTENANLKHKLSHVTVDLRKVRRSLSNVEDTHRCVSDKYDYLKYSSETVLNKAQSDLEKKETMISHLECKLKLMEERLNARQLPQDEQVQSLVNQRISLEQKLDESHQQLVNIKLTWSDAINQLETQVSHLNSKIAEDCEEISLKDKEIQTLQTRITDTEKLLTTEIMILKENNSSLASKNEILSGNIEELLAKLTEQKTESSTKLKEAHDRQEQLEQQTKVNENLLLSKIEDLSHHLRNSADILKGLKSLKLIAT